MKSMCKKSIDAEHVKVSQNMFYTTIQNSTKRKKKKHMRQQIYFPKTKEVANNYNFHVHNNF